MFNPHHCFSPRDCYYTPYDVFVRLRNLIQFSNSPQIKTILEPCAGDGRIADWLEKEFPLAHVSPNDPRETGKLQTRFDFLDVVWNPSCDLIVTNPPYSRAFEFVQRGLVVARSSAWLLRLDFLASQGRSKFFKDNPLHGLYVLSKRPSFDGKGTDRYDYGWFVWDRVGIFKPGIHHI